MNLKCNSKDAVDFAKEMMALPRKFFLAGLGFIGLLPELVQETIPHRVSDLLADSENLYNQAAERGEIILEERRQ